MYYNGRWIEVLMVVDKNEILGKRLKLLREKLGKNQEHVANTIGISRARYSHYENNHVEPDIGLIRKLANYFNVTTDYLLGNSDNPDLTEDESFEAFINDPELERWYKELPKNDEEDLKKLRKMWEIIKSEEE